MSSSDWGWLKLSENQLARLSGFCSDLGIVFVASVFIPSLLDGLSKESAVAGISLAVFFWIISLRLAK